MRVHVEISTTLHTARLGRRFNGKNPNYRKTVRPRVVIIARFRVSLLYRLPRAYSRESVPTDIAVVKYRYYFLSRTRIRVLRCGRTSTENARGHIGHDEFILRPLYIMTYALRSHTSAAYNATGIIIVIDRRVWRIQHGKRVSSRR